MKQHRYRIRQYGATRAHAAPSSDALAWAEHADRQRTLYVLDLREAPSYVAGHHPPARNVSGGQVPQAIDVHASVWNARIVLIDEPSLVRARQTAYRLGQLGSFEVGIIAQPELPDALVQGALPAPVRYALRAQISVLDVARLVTALAGSEPPTVVDLSLSPGFQFLDFLLLGCQRFADRCDAASLALIRTLAPLHPMRVRY